jgi:16S rRNA (uracil1498-N3)-methyltransferase
LTRVLRAKAGDTVQLLDGGGKVYTVTVATLERRSAAGTITAVDSALPEPGVTVTLYQCALKADKLEWVWQKATELGATTLVPVISSRAVVRPTAALERRRPRWESIVREAAEQSGRGTLPTVAASADLATILQDAPGLRLLAWEEGAAHPSLIHALGQAELPVRAVSLLIGPEGGLSAEEVTQAETAGWQTVTLGPRILRAETAAVAALAITLAALGELGGAEGDPSLRSG